MEGVCVKCTGVFDETYATLAAFPVIGFYYKKVHNWYHNKTQHKCHHQGCSSAHIEHSKLTDNETNMSEFPCNEEFIIPNPEGSQIITMSEVDARYGQLATILIMFDRPLLKVKDFQPETEFTWLVSRYNTLLARFQNRLFIWDGEKWEPEFEVEIETVQQDYEQVTLDKAYQIILMFMANEEIYNSMLNWDKSKAFIEAENFLETISKNV